MTGISIDGLGGPLTRMLLVLTFGGDVTFDRLRPLLDDVPLPGFKVDLWRHYRWDVTGAGCRIEDPVERVCEESGVRAQEYPAWTDPRDRNSKPPVGQLNVIQNATGNGLVCTVSWAAVDERLYRAERSLDLKQQDVVADSVEANPPLNTINDEIVPKPDKVFCRIVVQ